MNARRLLLLPHPGGNATGVLIASEGTLAANRFQLLTEALPRARRIALLAPDDAVGLKRQAQEVREAAAALGVELIEVAAKHPLPATCEWPERAEEGGFMAYGTSLRETYRRIASCLDRLLRGERPGELPVLQPTELRLVINLKTPSALGLTISHSVLLRADEVIQ